MISHITLGLCAFGAAALVYSYDPYRREPISILSLAFGLGVGAMSLASWIEAWTFDISGIGSSAFIAAVASLEEEILKLLAVVVLAVIARRRFDDPMDGIVFGSICGLGMAVEESMYYLRQLPPADTTLPLTEMVRIVGHLVMGGISGFGFGRPVLSSIRRWALVLAGCFSAATALHFGWDWVALRSISGSAGAYESWCAIVLVVAGLLLYGVLTAKASEESRLKFAPNGPSQLWGWPFNSVTNSSKSTSLRRLSGGRRVLLNLIHPTRN